MNSSLYRGRIAPSPTGYLHLGHAKTFWSAYQRYRDAKGVLIYRDEDIDPHRCRDEFSKAAIDDLKQLGISWDEGPIKQSERLSHYTKALEVLIDADLVYPCIHSRKKIKEAIGPIAHNAEEPLFPLELRPKPEVHQPPIDLSKNWRFKVPENAFIRFEDLKQGPQAFEGQKDFGDFLVWRKEGVPSYELAVVVDDIEMQITEVVRGKDLLVSTARQWLIYEGLSATPPTFYHEDLVKDESGERLAKRKDSLALRTLFSKGHTQESLEKLWIESS
ncbi:MAG: glutamate--tRNA ligase family protein [Verrucomicrobia bacterium]|nr:glutamate--tRNA ligase family protein [Verrucomicrobiota bacterium]MDA1068681.1 glutamate--tRNA ligase family protein [Verrucomicrobiota bacterium]